MGMEKIPVKQAMTENKILKVFIASGCCDLDFSYFATQYVVNRLGLDTSLRSNVMLVYYDAGDQVRSHLPSLKKLTADVAAFSKKSPQ